MTYYERRYESRSGSGPVDVLGREASVLCDRCGFSTHYRPSVDSDGVARCDGELIGWTWEPTGRWCWDFHWSMDPRLCDRCGRDANERVTITTIVDEIKQMENVNG